MPKITATFKRFIFLNPLLHIFKMSKKASLIILRVINKSNTVNKYQKIQRVIMIIYKVKTFIFYKWKIET